MKSYAIIALFYILAIGFIYWGYKEKLQFNYPSSAFYEVFGLDGSHHQGQINWKEINLKKFRFVYLKATEGETFKDRRFQENYKQASQLDIIVGGYHFWSFCKPAYLQLNNMLKTIPVKKGDLVPAVDIETSYSCGKILDRSRVSKDLLQINDFIKLHYGKLPVIYTTEEFTEVYPEILKGPNLYWLRSLMGPPNYKSDWAIWQYYHAGTAKGISGPVDLNVLRKKSLFEDLIQ